MEYVNRLTQEDVKELLPFEHIYEFKEIQSNEPNTRAFKMKKRRNGRPVEIVIGDTFLEGNIKDFLPNEDFFINFMVKKFGKDFRDWHSNKTYYSTRFVSQLTDEEIMELVPFYQIFDFERCEPTEKGTIKFHIQPTYCGPAVDVIISDGYELGNLFLYGVNEENFVRFLTKKFGEQYCVWYVEHVKVKTLKDINEYAKNLYHETTNKIIFCKDLLNGGQK